MIRLSFPARVAPARSFTAPFIGLPAVSAQNITKFANDAKKRYSAVLHLGIGGSSLGAQALYEGVAKKAKGLPLHFLDNVDPSEVTRVTSSLPLKKTLLILASKSGTTLETLAVFFALRKKLGKTWQKQVAVITDPETGYLRDLARRESLPAFSIPPDVGGRYSVLSPMGLLPAALAGISPEALLRGARQADTKDALRLGSLQASEAAAGRRIVVFFPYASALKRTGEWYAQLLAESTGKSATVGLTPYLALGATDQHSALQLFADGPHDKQYLFITVDRFAHEVTVPRAADGFDYMAGHKLSTLLTAEAQGTMQALRERGRSVTHLQLPDLTPQSIGELLQLLMLSVPAVCSTLGVTPFDQPGVERGKVIAKGLLTKERSSRK